jgi:hypothetical protein
MEIDWCGFVRTPLTEFEFHARLDIPGIGSLKDMKFFDSA